MLLIISCATSRAVLEAVQKSRGDSHHPMGRPVGFTILMGSSSHNLGKTKQKCQAFLSDTTNCQNPSFISHFAKNILPSFGSARAMVATIHQSTFPICSIDSQKDRGVVASLTLGSSTSSSFNWKDRSKIALKIRLLWGTAASGEIFKFGCGSCFMSSHQIISASPCSTFSNASCHRHRVASGDFADACGPLCMAASKCSFDHPAPQSTGHPSVAYWNNVAYAG